MSTGVSAAGSQPGVAIYHAGTKLVDGRLVTNGGRVLAVCVKRLSLVQAAAEATETAGRIEFEGAVFRRDIAARAIARFEGQAMFCFVLACLGGCG